MTTSQGSDRIDSIIRRISWAEKRLRELRADMESHFQKNPVVLRSDPQDGPSSEYLIKVEKAVLPDFISVGFRVGEIVHALRGALDMSVWHLAVLGHGSDPPPKDWKVQFPIDLSGDSFTKGPPEAIQSLTRCPQAIIEWSQPYHGRNAPNPELLAILRWLSNTDKHRVITPVAVIPASFQPLGEIVTSGATQLQEFHTGETVEDGATVYKLVFDQATQVQMNLNCTIQVSIDLAGCDPPGPRVEMVAFLNSLMREVGELIRSLRPFF